MLRPSRPMMRPLRSSLGRSTTDTVVSIACSAALRWMASVMILLRAVGRRLARFGVEPLDQVGGVVPRIAFDLLEQQLACLVGGQAGDPLELALLLGDELLDRASPRPRPAARARASASSRPRSSCSSRSVERQPLGQRPRLVRQRLLEAGISCWRSAGLALGLAASSCAFSRASSSGFLPAGFGVARRPVRRTRSASSRACSTV